jgi:hypothetical protein
LLINNIVNFGFIPPPLPLSPFPTVSGEDLREYASEVINLLSDATLPTSPDELLAILVSETTAGFTGGVSSRLVAAILGDVKRDSSFLKGTAAGAYFGVRGIVRTLSAIVGLPPQAAIIISDIAASIYAEEIKVAGRQRSEEIENLEFESIKREEYKFESYDFAVEVGDQNNEEFDVKHESVISIPEIVQDVTKWVAYDLLLPSTDSISVPIVDAVQYGSLSGLAGAIVYELCKFKDIQNGNLVEKSGKMFKACLEGGALFASYEASISFFETSTTPEVKEILLKKFTDFNFF